MASIQCYSDLGSDRIIVRKVGHHQTVGPTVFSETYFSDFFIDSLDFTRIVRILPCNRLYQNNGFEWVRRTVYWVTAREGPEDCSRGDRSGLIGPANKTCSAYFRFRGAAPFRAYRSRMSRDRNNNPHQNTGIKVLEVSTIAGRCNILEDS